VSNVAGSRQAQRELDRHRKDKEAQTLRDLRWVMSTAQGRRFMFDLIDQRCLVFSPSYTGNSETYLREGRRIVGIEVMREVQKECAAEYVQMMSEAFNLKKRDDLVEAAAQTIAEGDDE
jgi:hypothetical protein